MLNSLTNSKEHVIYKNKLYLKWELYYNHPRLLVWQVVNANLKVKVCGLDIGHPQRAPPPLAYQNKLCMKII